MEGERGGEQVREGNKIQGGATQRTERGLGLHQKENFQRWEKVARSEISKGRVEAGFELLLWGG